MQTAEAKRLRAKQKCDENANKSDNSKILLM